MNDRETAQIIDDAAADWAAKLDRGLSDVERQALELWLSGDARRIGALARARAIWSHAELGLASGHASVAEPAAPPAGFTRRRLIAGGIAAAVAGAVLIPVLRNRPDILASGVGEVRKIGLEDGSTVTLGAASRISVAFAADERRLNLLAGEAFFDVAQDPLRPFVVIAERLTLRATDTAFGVRMLAGAPLSVLVSQGTLLVNGLAHSATTTLDANMRLELSGAAGDKARIERLEPDALRGALAWRDGMLSFEGETLAAATAQFDRYAPVRFEITDPALARATITGLFAANDPKGFARAIAPSLNARAEITGDLVRLSPASPAK